MSFFGIGPKRPKTPKATKPFGVPGKPLFLCSPYVDQTLVKGSFKTIVVLPKYVDRDEWLAFNTFEFFNYITMFHGIISDYCTPHTCPVMSGGPGVEYAWIDANQKKTRYSAPHYFDTMATWIHGQLADESRFPTKSGLEFPKDFVYTVRTIFRHLIRVLIHIYHSHYDKILNLTAEAHFNALFAHFVCFGKEFELLEQRLRQEELDIQIAAQALEGLASAGAAEHHFPPITLPPLSTPTSSAQSTPLVTPTSHPSYAHESIATRSNGVTGEGTDLLSRVSNLPIINSAFSLYNTTKSSSRGFRYGAEIVENGVNRVVGNDSKHNYRSKPSTSLYDSDDEEKPSLSHSQSASSIPGAWPSSVPTSVAEASGYTSTFASNSNNPPRSFHPTTTSSPNITSHHGYHPIYSHHRTASGTMGSSTAVRYEHETRGSRSGENGLSPVAYAYNVMDTRSPEQGREMRRRRHPSGTSEEDYPMKSSKSRSSSPHRHDRLHLTSGTPYPKPSTHSNTPSPTSSSAGFVTMVAHRAPEQSQTRSRWTQLVVEGGKAAGTTAAIVSEESMKCLKYCLSWLQYATQHIDQQISLLRDFLISLASSRDPEARTVATNSSASHLANLKREVVDTIRKVVEVVSKYAGAALPESAKANVKHFILSLPGRWASVNDIRSTATTPRGSPMLGPQSGPGPRSGEADQRLADNAVKVMYLAIESVDMLRSVTNIFSDTVERAEVWLSRLRYVGVAGMGMGGGPIRPTPRNALRAPSPHATSPHKVKEEEDDCEPMARDIEMKPVTVPHLRNPKDMDADNAASTGRMDSPDGERVRRRNRKRSTDVDMDKS
ncbi:hypothetical protein BZG36_01909 [Bifiguratus adelaidae]|uniref:Uncharacterized protein n=1 Tax=Bifiguratus adelaidae TaxID=1938954 RepID=A0A261Y4J3_9FUNG|nr:hypothetical protein BZG36_01909 [Bifiguratus adelaidae]